MCTAQSTNKLQLMQDQHEAQYKDDSLEVAYDEQRRFCINRDAARAVLRLYASRGIALHNQMSDDMIRSCFYEYAGADYQVSPYQIEVLRSMV